MKKTKEAHKKLIYAMGTIVTLIYRCGNCGLGTLT